MLTLLTNRLAKEGIHNVTPILGTNQDARLTSASVDLAILVDVYHEFDYPYEMMTGLVRSLKPGGRIALVEFRGEDPSVPIKELHKMTQAQVRKEMSVHALEWVETLNELPWQHVIVFRKKS
jgi:ubiquinone/menaquinone biosynthesis C-methylase UbiE